jgi:hydrogenase nickel incorporation protein HypA/HybF
MHEFGIAEQTLALVLDQTRRRAATRVHQVTVRIGDLSGVVPEAFEFAFSALREGTPAADARLVIERVPLVCYCAKCRKEFETQPGLYHCPACAEQSADVRRGREMDLMSIEVS